MSTNYKTILAFSAALIAIVTGSVSSYADETLSETHNANHIASDLENWYSEFFTGASYITKSDVPVFAFSACASNEDIALMLASAALSTHNKTNIISSHEHLSNDSSYGIEIESKTSGLEVNFVVLRKDQVRSAPPEICVLITQE